MCATREEADASREPDVEAMDSHRREAAEGVDKRQLGDCPARPQAS